MKKTTGCNSVIIKGSFEVKLPTNWTDEKHRWEEAEKRREEKRREEERISKKRKPEERISMCAKR